MVRSRVLVAGRVQGVSFRDSCRREAATRGVAGWVRNLPDGRVEAVFEGPEAAVRSLVDWCRHGPRTAGVSNVTVLAEPTEGLRDFQIR